MFPRATGLKGTQQGLPHRCDMNRPDEVRIRHETLVRLKRLSGSRVSRASPGLGKQHPIPTDPQTAELEFIYSCTQNPSV